MVRAMEESSLPRRLGAEAFGTFCLLLVGTGAIVVDDVHGGCVTHLGVSLAFGLIVLAMIETVGDRSGAHLNPAVTLGFARAGRFPWREVVPYVVAQLVGAVSASLLLRAGFQDHSTLGATLPKFGVGRSFVVEMVITFLLMVVILCVAHGSKERGTSSALSIGSFVFLAALVAGPLTGASMNPARSLAPALVSGRLDGLWIYLVAPCVGAWCATPCCRWLRGEGCCDDAAAPGESRELNRSCA